MSETQISADDIARWETLDNIAASLEKRGLEPRPTLNRENGFEDELLIETEENKYIALINAAPGDEPSNYNKFQSSTVPTTFVSTRDFQTFSIIRRKRIIGGDKHGRLDRQKFSFDKEQITSGDRYSALDKLNDIEYGDDSSLNNLFDTRQVVDEFYEGFESIRTDLVAEVEGIPDDRGDAKQRYVQVTLNRLIFLHFIQEKGLLGAGEDDYLLRKHDEFAADGDVQTDFYEPLFFKALAEEGFQSRKFDRVPYLNGGLFSETEIEQEFENARLGADAAESDGLYREILEFLDSWNWNVDERLDVVEPKNLSPAVLGHIFEQSVNQKEKGAYYTPEEITSFMARESIHPRILDGVNRATGADYEEIDAIFGLDETAAQGESGDAVATDGGAITQQAAVDAASADHVETLYFDVLKHLHVLDPAVGSGAFLLAAEDVLLDIYLHAIEYFEQLYEEQPFGVSERVKDELDAVNEAGSKTLYAKREIILNNLYGVDIDDGAVEICKLRLWLSMVADIEDDPSAVDPLPNIDFNIRQGNSLIGFTELVEVDTDGNEKLTNYGAGAGEGVREKYEDVIEATNNHRQAQTKAETERWRAEAERHRREYAADLDEKILDEFHDAGINEIDIDEVRSYSPFHWVIEFPTVYETGGFDIIIGNPPWEVLTVNRDDFFPRYDPRFRTYSSDRKDAVMKELLNDGTEGVSGETIASEWEEWQANMERRADYFNNSETYELQSPEGVASENDLWALFLERCLDVAKDETYTSLILPANFVNGAASQDLRANLLDETDIEHIITFENHGIFNGLDDRYRFGTLTYKNSGRTDAVRGTFQHHNFDIVKNVGEHSVRLSRGVLENYSPSSRIIPYINSQRKADVLDTLLDYPQLADERQAYWADILTKELHEPSDKHRFVSSPEEGDYPIYDGENLHQFAYNSSIDPEVAVPEEPRYWGVEGDSTEVSARERVKEKKFNNGEVKKPVYLKFKDSVDISTRSQIGFVNDLLDRERGHEHDRGDVLPDAAHYRVAYRDVANVGNEYTMIATVLPPEILCLHTVQTFKPTYVDPDWEDLQAYPLHGAYNRIFTDEQLFATVGLLNSLPFDYLIRTKVDEHLVKYKIEESTVPRLTEGDDWFKYIWRRAARLNCYGDAFAEMRSRLGGLEPITDEWARRQARIEIDAAAFHAYGLAADEVEFILDDFNTVQNPDLRDQSYFESALDKYRELSNDQPAGH